MRTRRNQLGPYSRAVVDALREQPDQTLEELAVKVYGYLDPHTRRCAQSLILNLRAANGVEIERRSVYRLRSGGK